MITWSRTWARLDLSSYPMAESAYAMTSDNLTLLGWVWGWAWDKARPGESESKVKEMISQPNSSIRSCFLSHSLSVYFLHQHENKLELTPEKKRKKTETTFFTLSKEMLFFVSRGVISDFWERRMYRFRRGMYGYYTFDKRQRANWSRNIWDEWL